MEKYLELSDVMLVPDNLNLGWTNSGKLDYFVLDDQEVTGVPKSLPIFTSPMEAIVGVDNWKVWQDSGIKPILPRTVELGTRLEACGFIFCAFSLQEVRENFINIDQRGSTQQFHICIDSGNGHDVALMEIGQRLKQLYGKQVILMGGNIANPKTYEVYSGAGFDYVRVGISSGSLVDQDKYGFHYPMASILGAINSLRKSGKGRLRDVKVIADGGITCHSDILKAIALGADYVMIGREFAKILEASGTIYKRTVKSDQDIIEEVQELEGLVNMSPIELSELDLVRQYFGNTTPEMQALRAGYSDVNSWRSSGEKPRVKVSDSEWTWVEIGTTLKDWIQGLKECINYGFMMSNAKSWKEFRDNTLVIRVR